MNGSVPGLHRWYRQTDPTGQGPDEDLVRPDQEGQRPDHGLRPVRYQEDLPIREPLQRVQLLRRQQPAAEEPDV